MMPGKRGRNEVLVEIVEVKQDELIKDRPREDQIKLIGIAFVLLGHAWPLPLSFFFSHL